MTLTREPSGRRASQIGLRFVDAAADLADDALADVEELLVVAEADAGLLDLAVDFDVDVLGAVDHDVGDVVAREQRLQRTIAEHVVADVLEQFLLLGDRHREILDRDDVVDDVADFLARAFGIQLGELRQVDRVDQRAKTPATWCRSRFRCARADCLRGSGADAAEARPGLRRHVARQAPPKASGARQAAHIRCLLRRLATGRRLRGSRAKFRRAADAVVAASLTEHDRLPLHRDRHFFFLRLSLPSRLPEPAFFFVFISARPVSMWAISPIVCDDRVLGIHFAEHAPVVGGIAEQLRVERDDRHRCDAERLGEVCRPRSRGALACRPG